MLEDKPKLKKILLKLLNHPYSSRPRVWVRWFVIPFVIKRGKGSILRRSVRLDIIPSKKCIMGYRTIVEQYAIINNGLGDVIIGDYSKVCSRATIIGPVSIGKKVVVGNGTQIAGMYHNYALPDVAIDDQGVTPSPVVVEDDVWIGGNATINQGVRLGTHSLIGAGSVVTKDVAPYTIVAGNPARAIKVYDFKTGQWISVKDNDKGIDRL